MAARHEVVEGLVNGALAGMTEMARDASATNDEIISAYFTLMRRGIFGALSISNNPKKTREALRQSVYTVLADLTDDVRN